MNRREVVLTAPPRWRAQRSPRRSNHRHFHNDGNRGRNDIDDAPELNYRSVMQQIAALGFAGFVTHE